jgi:hypothetical protein
MSLVLLGSTSGSVTLQEPAVAGTTTLTLPAVSGTILQSGTTVTEAQGGTGTTTGYYGFKNRIINGAMVIDQRNAGALITSPASAQYLVDRFFYRSTIAAKFNAQQNAGSVTPPTGFINYLGMTSTSAYSVGSGDRFNIAQNIEGLNVADLGWGAAGATTVTLSFQVYSSLTGTFGGALQNSAGDRSYPFTYTVSSANTWTPISVTIAGDTSGTWLKTNGTGIAVYWGLGAGSTTSGTAGAWAAAGYFSATGAVSVVGTNGATFYITGVQLEKGSTATSFDYRPYGTELALCQRYYWRAINGTNQHMAGTAYYFSATEINMAISCPMPMRATPTLEQVTGIDFYFFTGALDYFDGWTNLQFFSPSTNPTQINLYVTSGVSGTSGQAGGIRANNASCSIAFAAEL